MLSYREPIDIRRFAEIAQALAHQSFHRHLPRSLQYVDVAPSSLQVLSN